MALYSERLALPQAVIQEVVPLSEGEPVPGEPLGLVRLGEEVERVSREGVVRELEVDAHMSKATATKLRDWLTLNIEKMEGPA